MRPAGELGIVTCRVEKFLELKDKDLAAFGPHSSREDRAYS